MMGLIVGITLTAINLENLLETYYKSIQVISNPPSLLETCGFPIAGIIVFSSGLLAIMIYLITTIVTKPPVKEVDEE